MTRHKIQIVTVMTVRIPLPHALSFGRINSAVRSRRSARSGEERGVLKEHDLNGR